jgi:hypothetical protein
MPPPLRMAAAICCISAVPVLLQNIFGQIGCEDEGDDTDQQTEHHTISPFTVAQVTVAPGGMAMRHHACRLESSSHTGIRRQLMSLLSNQSVTALTILVRTTPTEGSRGLKALNRCKKIDERGKCAAILRQERCWVRRCPPRPFLVSTEEHAG